MTPSNANTSGLEPCPFCGGEAWLNDYEAKYSDLPPMSRAPQCRSCGASLGYLPTPAKATEAWNCRARIEPTSDNGVKIALEALEKAIWSLGSFGHLVADEEGGNTEGLEDEVVVRMTFPDPEYGGEKTLLGELFVRAFRKAKSATDECRLALADLQQEG